jgi:hypothetical protein
MEVIQESFHKFRIQLCYTIWTKQLREIRQSPKREYHERNYNARIFGCSRKDTICANHNRREMSCVCFADK